MTMTMAFYRCPAIDTLNSRSLTPPALGMDVFGGYGYVGGGLSFANARLYVPQTTGTAYSAANTWQNFSRLTADIPVGHDTVWVIDTTIRHDTTIVHDTLRDTIPITIHDTSLVYDTLRDTIPITIHDTTWRDTTIHRDSIIYDTIIHKDSVAYDTIIHKDSIAYNTIHRDTLVYDTFHYTVTLIDTTLIPDTVWQERIIIEQVEVHDTLTLYIVIDQVTATPHAVTDETRVNDAGDGIVLSNLTPNTPFAIYNLSGELVYHATASSAGAASLRSLPPGTYLLSHAGYWSKFTHQSP